MTSKSFLIAPYEDGKIKALEPWLVPEGAYVEMTDAYYYQGKIYKKNGYIHLGRLNRDAKVLPEAVGNTDGTDTFVGNLAEFPIEPGSVVITIAIPGMSFTDNENGTLTEVNAVANFHWGEIDYETGALTLHFDPAPAGASPITAVYRVCPRLPVMGLPMRETSTINEEGLMAFDTDRSYDYNTATDHFRDVSFYKMAAPQNPVLWTGQDYDFFWTENYKDVLWATNNVLGLHVRAIAAATPQANPTVINVGAGHTFVVGDVVFINEMTGMTEINGLTGTVTVIAAATITVNINSAAFAAPGAGGYVFALTNFTMGNGDGIRYYDGFGANLGWKNFQPYLQEASATPTYLKGALIILPYKDRLICLNTLEGTVLGVTTRHAQRVRWSQNGTPFYDINLIPTVAPASRAGSEWAEDIPGKGGFLDAPTNEQIVSASYNNDTLIVFFERSTWQLRYTGSEILPFSWEKINSDLGCESTFSPISFDKGVLAVGDKAIVSCNSIAVDRIDEKIPFQVFDIDNDSHSVKRVHGTRDFYKQFAFWTYPDSASPQYDQVTKFPGRVLAYNYLHKTWSVFKDSFTCYGSFQITQDLRWIDLDPFLQWDDATFSWNSGVTQSHFPSIVAGNQAGHVLKIEEYPRQNEYSLDLCTTVATLPISATDPAIVTIVDHNLEEGYFIKFYWTTAFPIAVVAEDEGTALAGLIIYQFTLSNIGFFPASVVITMGAVTLQDLGNGILASSTAGYSGTIDYLSGYITLAFPALAVDTAITATYNYNLLNNRNYYVVPLSANTFSIFWIDVDGFPQPFDATAYADYTGFGSISVLNNFDIKTKRFNPFINEATGIRISFLDFFLENTSQGEITCNVFVDETSTDPIINIVVPTYNVANTSISQAKNWQRVYVNVTGSFLQFQLTLSNLQMAQDIYNMANFILHGTRLNLQPSGRAPGFC